MLSDLRAGLDRYVSMSAACMHGPIIQLFEEEPLGQGPARCFIDDSE